MYVCLGTMTVQCSPVFDDSLHFSYVYFETLHAMIKKEKIALKGNLTKKYLDSKLLHTYIS